MIDMKTVQICLPYRWGKIIEHIIRDMRDRKIPYSAYVKFWWQRRTRGFDDRVTYGFDHEIIKWVLPRLKVFKQFSINHSYPCDLSGTEEWEKILDEMIEGMELMIDDPIYYPEVGWFEKETKKQEIIEKSLDLFRKYFRDLWW
jgi:hypothetical protein